VFPFDFVCSEKNPLLRAKQSGCQIYGFPDFSRERIFQVIDFLAVAEIEKSGAFADRLVAPLLGYVTLADSLWAVNVLHLHKALA
jgi:hypothetical protein